MCECDSYSHIFLDTILHGRANGWRYPLVCLDRLDNQAGRDNAVLPEPTPSHANCLKTRRLPPVGCTLCWVAILWLIIHIFATTKNYISTCNCFLAICIPYCTTTYSTIILFSLRLMQPHFDHLLNNRKSRPLYSILVHYR